MYYAPTLILALVQVFGSMEGYAVRPDVVTCCSLVTALEMGGRWDLSLQVLLQMCEGAGVLQGTVRKLQRVRPSLPLQH